MTPSVGRPKMLQLRPPLLLLSGRCLVTPISACPSYIPLLRCLGLGLCRPSDRVSGSGEVDRISAYVGTLCEEMLLIRGEADLSPDMAVGEISLHYRYRVLYIHIPSLHDVNDRRRQPVPLGCRVLGARSSAPHLLCRMAMRARAIRQSRVTVVKTL